ncbi:hypothetical protein [uncultured Paraglaciecola sp.]|uniref:hypothetical protein n=1 Tax=uncultured Paraglaciecola sp. TaxID=1765024 RepID=UPI002634BFBA|nr:hypothetical protein [uncultured Paraglaciecola sp.]
MHIRQQLRKKIKSLLEPALLNAVHVNRTKLFSPSELPGIIVTTSNEVVEHLTFNSSNREIELTITIHEKAFSTVDDQLDALCVKIENAISNDTTIKAQDIELNATTIEIEDGDQPVGIATMIYTAKFLDVTDPEQVI